MNNSRNGINRLKKIMARSDFGIILIALCLFLYFSFFTNAFFTAYNIYNLLRTTSQYIFIALSMSCAVVLGGTNLAVGAIGGFSAMIVGLSLENWGLPIPVAVLLALLTGFTIGAIIGTLISKLKMIPFVVTLAFQFILFGLFTGVTKGYPFVNLPASIRNLGTLNFFGFLPGMILVSVFALLVMSYLMRYTVLGRQVLATGGNSEAARLSGINTDRITIICNGLSGFFSSCAALMYTTRMGTIQTSLGTDWMLIGFAVTVLGGCSTKGGEYTSIGVFAAALTMVLIKNGLTMASVDMYFEQAIQGAIILIAIVADSVRHISNDRSMLNDVKKRSKASESASQ